MLLQEKKWLIWLSNILTFDFTFDPMKVGPETHRACPLNFISTFLLLYVVLLFHLFSLVFVYGV
jgi:hypothetical protein